jgi:hypothetical protein
MFDKITRINQLHQQAMELAEQALLARRKGSEDEAERLSFEAYRLEAEAALMLREDDTAEPTRSVLLRSAATLALECGELREAEKLIATALIGNPPSQIADELRDLFEQVNARRRVEVQ